MVTINRMQAVLLLATSALVLAPPAWAQQPPATKAPGIPAQAASPKAPPSTKATKAGSVWRGQVAAHLNGQKRPFSNGADGTSMIGFTIDRSGKVLSARLIKSSGNAALDKEALALARRASPLPAPPKDVAGATLKLTAPVRFKR